MRQVNLHRAEVTTARIRVVSGKQGELQRLVDVEVTVSTTHSFCGSICCSKCELCVEQKCPEHGSMAQFTMSPTATSNQLQIRRKQSAVDCNDESTIVCKAVLCRLEHHVCEPLIRSHLLQENRCSTVQLLKNSLQDFETLSHGPHSRLAFDPPRNPDSTIPHPVAPPLFNSSITRCVEIRCSCHSSAKYFSAAR